MHGCGGPASRDAVGPHPLNYSPPRQGALQTGPEQQLLGQRTGWQLGAQQPWQRGSRRARRTAVGRRGHTRQAKQSPRAHAVAAASHKRRRARAHDRSQGAGEGHSGPMQQKRRAGRGGGDQRPSPTTGQAAGSPQALHRTQRQRPSGELPAETSGAKGAETLSRAPGFVGPAGRATWPRRRRRPSSVPWTVACSECGSLSQPPNPPAPRGDLLRWCAAGAAQSRFGDASGLEHLPGRTLSAIDACLVRPALG